MKKIIYICLSIGLFLACNRTEEDTFDRTPTERLQQVSQELYKELTSSEYGWKLVYQTNKQKFGGFTFVMKFDKQGQVAMVSDFDKSTITQQNSQYEIKTGQGILLSFVTKNHIHNLADAVLGVLGKGYEGEFEFVYIGKEDGKLKFKTQRTNEFLFFEKAENDDWQKMQSLINSVESLAADSYRYSINVISNSENKNYHLSVEYRYATFKTDTKEYKFGLIPTTDGLTLSPPLNWKGKQFDKLTTEGSGFSSTVDDTTFKITFSEFPASNKEDYKDIHNLEGLVMLTESLKETYLTSKKFKNLLTTEKGNDVFGIRIYFDSGFCDLDVLNDFGTGIALLRHFASYEIKDGKLFFKPIPGGYWSSNDDLWSDANNELILKQAIKIFNFLTEDNNGFYIEKRTEKFHLPNTIYVLQSSKYSDFYFPMYRVE